MPLVSRLALRQTAQAVRGQQAAGANIHNGFLLLPRKRTLRQRHGKNLIGTKGGVAADAGIVDHVVTAMGSRVPEFCEVLPDHLCHFLERLRGFAGNRRQLGHGFERVVPQRIDFNGFADSRSYHPIADFRIHPGELHPLLAGVKKTIGRIHVNVISSAMEMGARDLRQDRV